MFHGRLNDLTQEILQETQGTNVQYGLGFVFLIFGNEGLHVMGKKEILYAWGGFGIFSKFHF